MPSPETEADNVLSQYLPSKRKERANRDGVEKVEKEIGRVRGLLQGLERARVEAGLGVEKMMEGVAGKERTVLSQYEDKLGVVLKGIDRIDPSAEPYTPNDKPIEQLYLNQLQLCSTTETYLQNLQTKLSKNLHKLQNQIQSLQLDQPLQTHELPDPQTMRALVLGEIQACQRVFNRAMEEMQGKLDGEIQRLGEVQRELMEDMDAILSSRIQAMEKTLPNP